MQRVADAVAGKFCYGVMAASAATFTFWQTLGGYCYETASTAHQSAGADSAAVSLSLCVTHMYMHQGLRLGSDAYRRLIYTVSQLSAERCTSLLLCAVLVLRSTSVPSSHCRIRQQLCPAAVHQVSSRRVGGGVSVCPGPGHPYCSVGGV